MTNRAGILEVASGAIRKTSLASRGARAQFGAAVALITVIPLLALFYLVQSSSSGERLSVGTMWVVGAILAGTVCLGYALLFKYPRTIVRLRHHMELIARGELPDGIELLAEESDISALEKFLNLIVGTMKDRITTIREQSNQLLVVERQRVMTESLCTACHCLGQPTTTISCYLDLLRKESLSPAGKKYLSNCLDEADKMRVILGELQGITEYKTEEYCAMPDQAEDYFGKIIQTRCDTASGYSARPTGFETEPVFDESILAVAV